MGIGRSTLLGIALWCGFSQTAQAGAWNQNAGEGLVITTSGWFHASDLFQGDDVRVDFNGFTKTEMRLWLESGLTQNLTLVVNGAYQDLDYRDNLNVIKYEGFDDVDIGVQWQVVRKEGLAAAIRASYVIDSRIDNRFLDVQSNGDTLEFRALLGQSRETLIGDFFHDTQLAARMGYQGQFDSVHGTFTLGYKPTERYSLMAQGFADYTQSLADDGDRNQDRSQISGQLSLVHQFKPGRYAQIGGKMTFDGKNAVKERALLFSVWTEY